MLIVVLLAIWLSKMCAILSENPTKVLNEFRIFRENSDPKNRASPLLNIQMTQTGQNNK